METCPSLARTGFSIVTSRDPSNHCCLSNVLVDRHFQVSHEMIDWVKVSPPAGPLKDAHRVSLKHFWVVLTVRLESLLMGKVNLQPSLRSCVLFIRVFKYFAPFRFSSTPTSLPAPAAEPPTPPPHHSSQHDAAMATHQGCYCEGEEWCLVSFKHDARN